MGNAFNFGPEIESKLTLVGSQLILPLIVVDGILAIIFLRIRYFFLRLLCKLMGGWFDV
tara:strand:- start:247 stop:423 length:177 start_codon:yes stop_codon:yes gene_type:complete